MKSFPCQRSIALCLLIGYSNLVVPVPLLAAALQPAARSDQATLPAPVRTPQKVKVNRQAPATSAAVNEPRFSAEPTPAEIFRARVFAEPFVPIGGKPGPAENRALAAAITAYHRSSGADATLFESFLRDYPKSPWAAAVHLNLGLRDFSSGWFTRAMGHYEAAWRAAKPATDPAGRAISDRAFGELAQMYARLGRKEQLQPLLAGEAGRPFAGRASELVAGARDGLALMNTRPDRAYRCGPGALDRILARRDHTPGSNPVLATIPSTDRGTSLANVAQWAHDVGLNMQVAFRESAGSVVPTPAVVHWKLGHFAALFAEGQGAYVIEDPTFAARISASTASLDTEASGYFLIPAGALPKGWRAVPAAEAATIWGKGTTQMQNTDRTTKDDPKVDCDGDGEKRGMAVANAHAMVISLNISDVPLGYKPPYGPAIDFELTYNQREAKQPSVPDFSNVGPKWQHNWVSYVEEELLVLPNSPPTVVLDWLWPEVHRPGGGVDVYDHIFAEGGIIGTYPVDFPPSHNSVNKMQKIDANTYVESFPDGSVYTYGRKTGVSFPFRYFLTSITDPAGNVIALGYDGQDRLVSVTDALGQVMTFDYDLMGDPLKLTKVTDPFGRYCTIAYDGSGRLESITDELGLESTFGYRSTGDFIESMTTPYGTSTFDFAESGPNNRVRWLELTNPLGEKERVETRDGWSNLPALGPVPTGFTAGLNQHNRCTLFWGRKAYKDTFNPAAPDSADCTAGARIYHWLHAGADLNLTSGTLENIREPLEGARTWFAYAGQPGPTVEGTSPQPTQVARVLDDSSTQLRQFAYNAAGRMTQAVDPLGRTTTYLYDTNDIDLTEVRQKTGTNPGDYEVLYQASYTGAHLPDTVTDAAGQVTTYTYNSAGQVSTVTNAKSEVTSFYYDPDGDPGNPRNLSNTGYLVAIDGPLSGSGDTVTIEYDGYGRPRTVTDTEGYAVTTDYDVFDRPTLLTYPDTTTRQIVYDRLDAHYLKDRRDRVTEQRYNAIRQLVFSADPLGRVTQYAWCRCGGLRMLIDPAGNITTWTHDAAGRLTGKQYADGSLHTYRYETNTSRLKSVTDATGQVTNYAYFGDDQLQQVSYTNATISTPSVSFTYETYYPRLAARVDTLGTTTYAYNAITGTPTLGAGRLSSIDGPWANDTITYTYDELGRVLDRAIDGANNTTTAVYDALGRLSSLTNPLGAFAYAYVNATGRVDHVDYPNSQRVNFSYFNNAGDQRLQQIENLKPDTSNLSTFGYTYDAEGIIQSWNRKYDAGSVLTSTFKYDLADQLTEAVVPPASGPTPQSLIYRYDKAGNRTSEQIDGTSLAHIVNRLNQVTGIAAGGPVRFEGSLDEAGTVTVGGTAAYVAGDNSFTADIPLSPGTPNVAVVATDPSSNTDTNTYQVTVGTASPRTLTYDLNGNVTDNGAGQTYQWDAANRLTRITYTSGARTEFTYNGLGQRVKIVEKNSGGSTTSEKRFIWCDEPQPSEERDGSNNVTKRFYAGLGEQISGTPYYYTTDHLGSVREMTNASGVVQARYDYDPYGRLTKVSGSLEADFGFTGFYRHQTSGLNLALFRIYDPATERWLSPDPLGHRLSPNLYNYTGNDPINYLDSLGLAADVNLFANELHDGFNFFRAAEAMDSSLDSLLTVGGHGNSTGVYKDHAAYDGPVPIKELADQIRSTDKWRQGGVKTVRLIACNAGNGKYPQELADELGVEVEAPNLFAWYTDIGKHANGNDMIYGERRKSLFNGKKIPDTSKPGKYLSFTPKN
jgi:RHS repeat-associated protein